MASGVKKYGSTSDQKNYGDLLLIVRRGGFNQVRARRVIEAWENVKGFSLLLLLLTKCIAL